MRKSSPILVTIVLFGLLLVASSAWAAPQPAIADLQVVGGHASVSRSEAGILIHQTSPRAIIDWPSFGVPTSGVVEIQQPDSDAVAVIRVTSAAPDPARILGTIRSNGRLVVAKTTGTVKDATPLRAADALYVDWAIINDGNALADVPFYTDYTELYVDGVLRNAWLTSSLNAKGQFSVLDYAIGTLSAGNHTITIKTDTTSVLAEKSKSDNTYTKTIKIVP